MTTFPSYACTEGINHGLSWLGNSSMVAAGLWWLHGLATPSQGSAQLSAEFSLLVTLIILEVSYWKGKKKAFYYVQVWLCHVSFIGVALLHVRLGFEVTTRTWLLLHVYLRKMVELFTHPDNFFYPPVAWWLRNGTILYFYRNCLLLLFFVPRGKNLVDSIFISIIFTLSTLCMTFGLCKK